MEGHMETQIPERIKRFVWLIKHGRLLTSEYLYMMSICDPCCLDCHETFEDIIHLLRDCG